MSIIAIDGACRRNGQPNCLSAGGVYIRETEITLAAHSIPHTMTCHEEQSTNQRGELKALVSGLGTGLKLINAGTNTIYLVTDSEYIFNAITKEWYKSWARKGWVTAENNPVKNKDLWEEASALLELYEDDNLAVYHIKGHVIPFGKATAATLLRRDPTAETLYIEVAKKFDSLVVTKKDSIDHALQLFERNNGFIPPWDKFREMVICNMVCDLVAGEYIDTVDAAQ